MAWQNLRVMYRKCCLAKKIFSEEELAINTTEFIYNNVTTLIDLFTDD